MMPPKTSNLAKAKAKQKPQEAQREESLQAVVSGVCISEKKKYINPDFIGSCRLI